MDTQKLKSFWEKPEGTTGMLLLTGAGVAGGAIILNNIETIVKLLENTLYAGLLGGAIFGGAVLVSNNRFRFLVSTGFQSFMRSLTGAIIAIDPIGILENYLKEMRNKIRKIGGFITDLGGTIGQVRYDINNRKQMVESYLREASAAMRKADTPKLPNDTREEFRGEATLKSNMAARERDYIERRMASLAKMESIYSILKKMERNLGFLYQDTEHQVGLLKDEYKAVKASYRATKGAQEIINGDDAKELFEQTCQYVMEDIGTKLGEMDRFMEQAKDPLTSMSVKNEVFNEQGLDLLAQWEKSGILSYEAGSLGKNAKIRIAEERNKGSAVQEGQPDLIESEVPFEPKTQTTNSFSSIFNK